MQKEIRARLDSLPKTEASFVEPMECLSVSKLPEGSEWLWEILCGGPHKISHTHPLPNLSRSPPSLKRTSPFSRQSSLISSSVASIVLTSSRSIKPLWTFATRSYGTSRRMSVDFLFCPLVKPPFNSAIEPSDAHTQPSGRAGRTDVSNCGPSLYLVLRPLVCAAFQRDRRSASVRSRSTDTVS